MYKKTIDYDFTSSLSQESASYASRVKKPKSVIKIVRENIKELISWFGFTVLLFLAYNYFSDGSFSALLTLASTFQCFGVFLLGLKIVGQHTIAGVSQKSIILLITCLAIRLLTTTFYNGYLPVDKSGDWLYQTADVITAVTALAILLFAHKYCHATLFAQKSKDTCLIGLPCIISAILAIIVHPGLNKDFFADFCWAFALYLETYSMVPQLFMMGKLGGEVEALTSHFLACMAASKLFSIIFWAYSYTELTMDPSSYNFAGWAVLFFQGIQLLLYADFIYYYLKSMNAGRSLIII